MGSPSTPLVYLNNAATSFPKSDIAIQAFKDALERVPTGTRSGQDDATLETWRQLAADLLGAQASQVFFVPGATIGLNMALQGLADRDRGCLVDNRGHNAVLRTVANAGTPYQVVQVYDRHDHGRPEILRDACRALDPSVVCLSHASNVSGSIYELGPLIDAVHSACRAAVVVDASQSAGMVPFATLPGADAIVFPAHKHLHALPGAALLLTRVPLRPILFGGTGSDSKRLRIDDQWWRWIEVGCPNEAAIAAMVTAMQDASAHLERYRAAEAGLTELLWERLAASSPLEPIGRRPGPDRIGTIACRPRYGHAELEWARLLGHSGIVVRGGLHCSPDIHEQLGASECGTLRFSLGRYNTSEDIDRAIEVVVQVAEVLA